MGTEPGSASPSPGPWRAANRELSPSTVPAKVGARRRPFSSRAPEAARPPIRPLRIGAPADIVIGICNGLVGGLTGLGGIISTISCQLRGWSRDKQRAGQPVSLVLLGLIPMASALWRQHRPGLVLEDAVAKAIQQPVVKERLALTSAEPVPVSAARWIRLPRTQAIDSASDNFPT